MNHALLKACADELEDSGHSYKLPRGTILSDAVNYNAAVAAGGDLKNCHILVTQPFKEALKKQMNDAPRVNSTQVKIRKVKLISNYFGPEGAELRTASDPSDFLFL